MGSDRIAINVGRPKLNYFNYFTEIEETFVRRRGKNLFLSPIDWALMEAWQEQGIPLHVVIRGIETVFDAFDKNPGSRTIKGLLFCREEVEAQFEEWSQGQAGKQLDEIPAEEPMSTEFIRGHIEGLIAALRLVTNEHLADEISRVCMRLEEVLATLHTDHEKVDKSLNDAEEVLNHALLTSYDPARTAQIKKEIESELSQHKGSMPAEAFSNTVRLVLLKRIREEVGVPRLSLFFV